MTVLNGSLVVILCVCMCCCGKERNEGQEGVIRELIKQLAISEEKAGNQPVDTPSDATPKNDPRVLAYTAAQKLIKIGRPAWSFLMAQFGDERQSVGFESTVPQSVGMACGYIIQAQIVCLPEDYPRSLFRKGKEGKLHARPGHGESSIFTEHGMKKWVEDRAKTKLWEIQIEVLEWYIKKEKEIGFQDEEQRIEVLGPLLRQLTQLQQMNSEKDQKR